jgi:hypothetical protein
VYRHMWNGWTDTDVSATCNDIYSSVSMLQVSDATANVIWQLSSFNLDPDCVHIRKAHLCCTQKHTGVRNRGISMYRYTITRNTVHRP